MNSLTIADIAYHASVNPSLDFFFSNGRLNVSRSPITTYRLAGRGAISGKVIQVAACQPSDFCRSKNGALEVAASSSSDLEVI